MAKPIWVKDYQNAKEIRRISSHRKADIAAAILKHDGKEVTAEEINRLMAYSKSGLCSIFHDDHYGKRIKVNKGIAHGGRYVKESDIRGGSVDPADTLMNYLALASIFVIPVIIYFGIG